MNKRLVVDNFLPSQSSKLKFIALCTYFRYSEEQGEMTILIFSLLSSLIFSGSLEGFEI
jgi:hypothetical protein